MERNCFENRVAKFIAEERNLNPKQPILVTVSGGADSVALLMVLHSLGYSLVVAHCNFHLRGEESNRDEQWVRTLVSRLGLPLEVKHFDVASYEKQYKVSTEMACRELRYEWFRELCAKYGCQAIAVAHHADDAVETFLLNAMRGSGMQGLASIKPRNGDIVRPLLCVGRCDVEAYLSEKKVPFVVDSTNRENEYKRNRVRNVILPEIYRLFPEAKSGMLRTLHDMRAGAALYSEMLEQSRKKIMAQCGEEYRIDTEALMQMTNSATMLFEMTKSFGFNSIQSKEIYSSLHTSGKRFFSATHLLVVERTYLSITALHKQEDETKCINLNESIEIPVSIRVERCSMPFNCKGVDGQSVVAFSARLLDAGKVVLRHQRKGDRFRPFGMKGTKLLSDLFADAKLSEMEKRSVWVLEADGTILWVLGLRCADAYRVTNKDKTYIKLSYKKD